MNTRGVKVKIIDVTPTYVSFRYLSSNSRCRIKRDLFVNDFQTGKLEVSNPKLLDE